MRRRKNETKNRLRSAVGSIVRNIFNDVRDRAVQGPAQLIDGFQRDVLIFSQAVEGAAVNAVLFLQRVLGYITPFQRFPKRFIAYHISTSFAVDLLLLE